MLLAWQGKAGRKILGKWPFIWKMTLMRADKHVLICNLQISFPYMVLFNPDTRQGGINHLGGRALKFKFQDFLVHGDSNVISQEGTIEV
uniref:Uncharacterized protein n=1 Tax=Cebus imitator TaxID=2715852 RepID=A0A2K5PFI0_CEBIM